MSEVQEQRGPRLRTNEEKLAKLRALRARVAHEPVGAKMPDGTIYAGKVRDGKKVYVMPRNVSVAMDFNAAAAYARQVNDDKTLGHDDWRIPTRQELALLYQNRDIGALKGNLECSVKLEVETDGDYWSSTPASTNLPLMYVQQLETGATGKNHVNCKGVVRLVR